MESFVSITAGTEHLFVCAEDCGMRVTAMPSHRPRQTRGIRKKTSTTAHEHWKNLPLRFNGHFPDEPGLAGVY